MAKQILSECVQTSDHRFTYGVTEWDDGTVIPWCQPKGNQFQGVEQYFDYKQKKWRSRAKYPKES